MFASVRVIVAACLCEFLGSTLPCACELACLCACVLLRAFVWSMCLCVMCVAVVVCSGFDVVYMLVSAMFADKSPARLDAAPPRTFAICISPFLASLLRKHRPCLKRCIAHKHQSHRTGNGCSNCVTCVWFDQHVATLIGKLSDQLLTRRAATCTSTWKPGPACAVSGDWRNAIVYVVGVHGQHLHLGRREVLPHLTGPYVVAPCAHGQFIGCAITKYWHRDLVPGHSSSNNYPSRKCPAHTRPAAQCPSDAFVLLPHALLAMTRPSRRPTPIRRDKYIPSPHVHP